jgi:hypothetical protein
MFTGNLYCLSSITTNMIEAFEATSETISFIEQVFTKLGISVIMTKVQPVHLFLRHHLGMG